MSLFAQKLKTPNRHADDFGVFSSSQTQKSQLPLASKTNNSTSLELKTTSPA